MSTKLCCFPLHIVMFLKDPPRQSVKLCFECLRKQQFCWVILWPEIDCSSCCVGVILWKTTPPITRKSSLVQISFFLFLNLCQEQSPQLCILSTKLKQNPKFTCFVYISIYFVCECTCSCQCMDEVSGYQKTTWVSVLSPLYMDPGTKFRPSCLQQAPLPAEPSHL